MINDSKPGVAEFEHFESISNIEDLVLLQEFIKNPDLEENKSGIVEFFEKINVEINADDLTRAMQNHDFSL